MTEAEFESFPALEAEIRGAAVLVSDLGKVHLKLTACDVSIQYLIPWDEAIRLADWVATLAERAKEIQEKEQQKDDGSIL